METHAPQFFEDRFTCLTGRPPYPWQQKLFDDIACGRWPEVISLPTGSGKTAVLRVWLLALAWSLLNKATGVPRRLIWVVNRRVVVDQVSEEAAELLDGKLQQCEDVYGVLQRASSRGVPLAVSTLRGQRADTGDWARDPTTPAIVIGTVDMIGSRLLFRGYRSGSYHRPIHAGLLGIDALIVNDEAHLSPAFAWLLEQLHALNPAAKTTGKHFRVILLSATPAESRLKVFDHSPYEDAMSSETFRRLFEAPKTLTLHEVESRLFESAAWELATGPEVRRTLVFIESPEKALSFANRLSKDGREVKLMTGTMRGLERDQLANDPIFREFLIAERPSEPVWLVATSAAEVGVNLTCERLVTGLVEADRLLQRFGRLNRFGIGEGEAHVVHSAPKTPQHVPTLQYLRSLDGDISCRKVWENPPPEAARSERPRCAKLEPWLVDVWAQTTYKDRDVPPISPWLHGKKDDEPETELAWRADVKWLTKWRVNVDLIGEVLKQHPIFPQERLREPTKRVREKLETLATTLGEEQAAKTWLIQINSDLTAERIALTELPDDRELNGKLLVLPDGLGKLHHGMFQPELNDSRLDVADLDRARRRYLVEGGIWTRLGAEEQAVERNTDRKTLAEFARGEGLRAPLRVPGPEEEGKLLLYFGELGEKGRKAVDVALDKHQSCVADKARTLATGAGREDLADRFSRAGDLHDSGKHHEVWQRAFGGSMDTPLAKSAAPVNMRLLDGYRHELGSLLKATLNGSGETDDLLLHLITSHHAAGRPFFHKRQFDREELNKSDQAALEGARRYARLQNQFGHWGLAYLEAIFKSADGLVSAEEGAAPSE